MIAEGSFPFHGLVGDSSAAPRVGDGVMVLDDEARVRYASPNAVSALHRVGISANAVGMRLAELGFNDSPVRLAFEDRMPVIEEFEQTADVTLLSRCMPILAGRRGHRRRAAGARRHRGAQARQAAAVEGRDDPRDPPPGEEQPADDLVAAAAAGPPAANRRRRRRRSPSRCAASARSRSSTRRCRASPATTSPSSRSSGRCCASPRRACSRPTGRCGSRCRATAAGCPSTIATPLSVVLTELLQNAVDHGFPEGSGGGDVVVQLEPRPRTSCNIRVIDDGRGLDPQFELNKATGLGLSIVRTLVTTELAGTHRRCVPGMPEDFAAAGLGDAAEGQPARSSTSPCPI